MHTEPDMLAEEWRAVQGYEGLYEVSDRGRVRRCPLAPGRHPGHILYQGTNPRWRYRTVNLSRSGVTRTSKVHQLVARAFLGPAPSVRHEPDHLDGDKSNNRPGNLEWVTRGENIRRAIRLGLKPVLRGERHPRAKLTEGQVAAIRGLKGTASQEQLGKRFGVSQRMISYIHAGQFWPVTAPATGS